MSEKQKRISEKTSEKQYHHGDLKNALIKAGIEILAKEGVQGLSLRKLASHAGVSHAAPYAHFANKQELITAISAAGHIKLYDQVTAIVQRYPDEPLRQLVEVAWAYVKFGFDAPAHFRLVFSGILEEKPGYPELAAMAKKNFQIVREIVARCQAMGVLDEGDPDLAAVSVWGLVHGFILLYQEGQISHTLMEQYSLREMMLVTLNQISRVRIDMKEFGEE